MKVAAIVVCWNSAAVLERCLVALAAQSRAFDHVLLVNNASPDFEPPAWIGSAPLEILQMGHNAGFAAANNAGLRASSDCEWVALVNPDAFLAEDWLARMLKAVHDHPQAASFASRLLRDDDPTVLDGIGDAYHFSGLAWRNRHGRQDIPARRIAREVFSACAAAALYRRDSVMAVGGFDDRFFCYMEDVDLGFRLRLAGHRCLYVPTASARHVGAVSSGGAGNAFALYHGHRNLVWCFVKNMPGLLLICALPAHVMMSLAVWARYAWQGRGMEILRAKRDALRDLPAIMESRRRTQDARKLPSHRLLRMMAWWPAT